MNRKIRLLTAALSTLIGAAPLARAAEAPSADEMWRIIQEQQKTISDLESKLQETEEKVEATGEVLDSLQGGTTPAATPATGGALGDAEWGSGEHGTHSAFEHGKSGRTVVGGYGELHYNNLKGEGGASDKKEIDFHRAILFLGHQFTDRIRFFSEIEYEHAHTGKNGAVELEQAYLEFDLSERQRARAGLFLVPAGILNEVHEPPAFYGVERNPVEKYIVPTTWWVGGASLLGEIAPGWSYDAALHEGMKTSSADDYAVRPGRQATSEAIANDLALTGRIRYTGTRGVVLSATLQYQGDMTQGEDATAGGATLFETHAVLHRGPFALKALYALWNLEGDGPAAIGADRQEGWYVEPAWKPMDRLGLFVRYNQWDNKAGDSSSESEKRQWNLGANWWVHPDVVLKADYEIQDNADGRDRNGFNLGVGYQF